MSLKNNQGQLVKWFPNNGYGYGFIRFEGRDVFVHRTGYLTGFKPEIGQIVRFDFALAPDNDRPPVATNVRVIKTATAVVAEQEIKSGLKALLQGQGGAQ